MSPVLAIWLARENFYRRIADAAPTEPDTLAAFTAAKKALRQKYPDPFRWAPLLCIGSPE